jgi:hypothetical protein
MPSDIAMDAGRSQLLGRRVEALADFISAQGPRGRRGAGTTDEEAESCQ